jgi:hypothetical protein
VRVPDWVLNCVGFLAEKISANGQPEEFNRIGTGFFVTYHHPADSESMRFVWFVTAKHLVEEIEKQGRKLGVLVAGKDKNPPRFLPLPRWYYHPTDSTTDVAMTLVVGYDSRDSLVSASTKVLLTSVSIEQQNIGIGDEVFMPGLFTFVEGTKKQSPIMRYGNLAMLPDEQIDTDRGFMDAYLIEARSIGGLSGSPVYVRKTLRLPYPSPDEEGRVQYLHGPGGFFLLGLAHGHWDIKESQLNSYSYEHDHKRGVNMGICIVVPAYKILDILQHEYAAIRRTYRAERIPTADSTTEVE